MAWHAWRRERGEGMFCSYYCISYWYRRQQHTPAERLKQDATRVSLAVVPCHIVCVTVSVAPCWNTTCLLCLCWSLNGSIPFPHTSRPAYIINNKILKELSFFYEILSVKWNWADFHIHTLKLMTPFKIWLFFLKNYTSFICIKNQFILY